MYMYARLDLTEDLRTTDTGYLDQLENHRVTWQNLLNQFIINEIVLQSYKCKYIVTGVNPFLVILTLALQKAIC